MATNNEEKKDEQQQDEDLDFEVVVEGDEPAQGKQKEAGEADDNQDDEGEEREERRAKHGGDDRDGEQDDADLTPEQREKREKRRKERQLRKQRREAQERELAAVKAELAELRGQVGGTQQTIRQGEYQRAVAAYNTAGAQMQEAQRLMQEARQSENWGAALDAQEAYFEAKAKAERLGMLVARYEQAGFGRGDRGGSQQQDRGERRPERPDPEVTRQASAWRAKNGWYDPNRGDADSKIAAAIDEQLYEEGFDPRTSEYWRELDKRIAKQLPHRATRDNADEIDDDLDDTPSPTRGSGRERAAGGKKVVRISKERIEALRDLGVDVNDRKAMAPYIRQFQQYDREHPELSRGR